METLNELLNRQNQIGERLSWLGDGARNERNRRRRAMLLAESDRNERAIREIRERASVRND